MNQLQIIPGILEKDLDEIKRKISLVEHLAGLIHIDFLDGKFAENTSYLDVEEVNKIDTQAFLTLHIQTVNPEKYIPQQPGSVRKVILHVESSTFSRELLEEVQANQFEIGIALNPETEIYELEPFLNYADMVLFMTVHPGLQGQKFLPEVLDKIREFNKEYPDIPMGVDGGINDKTIKLVTDCGVTLIEAGSFLFDGDPQENFDKLLEAVQ